MLILLAGIDQPVCFFTRILRGYYSRKTGFSRVTGSKHVRQNNPYKDIGSQKTVNVSVSMKTPHTPASGVFFLHHSY